MCLRSRSMCLRPIAAFHVRVFLDESEKSDALFKLTAELRDGRRVIASQSKELISEGSITI